MAYDAAVEASVDPTLVDIYLSSAILTDPAWYSEARDPSIRLSRSEQLEMQLTVCTKGVARLEEWLDKLEIEPYVLAPIVSEEKWEAHEQTLETFGGSLASNMEPSDSANAKGLYIDTSIEGSQSIIYSPRSVAAKL